MQVELKKYLELSEDFSNSITYVLVSIGVLILLVGTFACCCTVKGQSSLLYLVSDVLSFYFCYPSTQMNAFHFPVRRILSDNPHFGVGHGGLCLRL